MNKKKILGYAVGPVGSGLLGFISLPIITWFYSVEDVGRISMLQVFMSLAVLLFCLGLDQAYVREYHEAKNKPALLKTVFLPCLSLSILSFILIATYDTQVVSKWLYGIPSTYLSIVTILCFIVALGSRFLSLILRMQERSFAFSMSQLLPKIIFLLIVVNTVWLGLAKDTYSLVTANVTSIIIAFIVFAWNTRAEWLAALSTKIDTKELKSALSFSWPLIFGGLASWGLNVMDRLFLRHFSTYTELGIYSITMSVALVVTIFAGIFNTIWSPMVYKWISEDKFDYKKIDNILDCVVAIIYFFIVLTSLFAWIIPYFLPQQYSDIQYLITVCLLGPLLYTLSEITGIGIAVVKRTKFSMLCAIVAMLSSAILNYLLVPKFGAAGAAISTAIAFLIFFILRTIISALIWRKKMHIKVFLIMFILLFLTNINLFLEEYRKEIYYLWLGMFVLGLFLFKKNIIKVICILFANLNFLSRY
ncbi:oligosaccharide flippase family protein [Acinetobacter indicus]|uniref:oligosaccharide flippase family protein n=1 Tax=Acinetobacter indicus TaxID=756892 RepID=UPI000CEC65FC|nr:oligosaccharide flippase family protein [Acinetobacter indicus]